MLDDPGRPLPDRIAELTTAMVSVDPVVQCVASWDVAFHRRPHLIARQTDPQRLAVELRHRLARLEAELRIEAERTIVVGGLQESDPGEAAAPATLHRIEHEATADRVVLRGGIDRNRADAGNRTAFIHKVAADHL